MFNRALWDHVQLWPTYLWPCLASALMTHLLFYTARLKAQGVTLIQLYNDGFVPLFIGAFYLAECLLALMLIYSMIIMGWIFIVAGLCTIGLMSTILAPIIGFFPFSQFITPVAFFSVLLSYAVLLGSPISEAVSHLNIVIFHNLVDNGIVSVNLILFAAAFVAKVFPAVAGKFLHKNG